MCIRDSTTVRPYNRYTFRLNGDGRTTVRPYNRYTFRLNGDGRTTVRPYNRYTFRLNGDGRTDRASLQRATSPSWLHVPGVVPAG